MTPPDQDKEAPNHTDSGAGPTPGSAGPGRPRSSTSSTESVDGGKDASKAGGKDERKDARKDEDGQDRGKGPAGPQPETADNPDAEEPEQHQRAWDTRRNIRRHSPDFLFGRKSHIGGSAVGGDQHGVSGGHVTGNVYMGGHTQYHFDAGGQSYAAGGVPETELERMAKVFAKGEKDDDGFAKALARLRNDRLVVLAGAPSTGRRMAALMLLREVKASPLHMLDPTVPPGKLPDQLTGAHGYALCDFAADGERPLREHHLRAVADELRDSDGYLVITTEDSAVYDGPPPVPWRQPPPADTLLAHLASRVDDPQAVERLLALPVTLDFLGRDHRPAELAGFARALAQYDAGHTSMEDLRKFSVEAVRERVRAWFDGKLDLHDKAFLVSLAAFHETPFPLTAELGDALYAHLQQTENPDASPRIPVFSTSTDRRLKTAGATIREQREDTEWGFVHQRTVHFDNPLTALELLREVWTGHPSARPGLLAWLRRLADDGRPLVRTRAAYTAAVLASADLPSAMALLIEPWALAKRFRLRVAAVAALAIAHNIDTPNVPQILRGWSVDPRPALRWTAVRTYAVIGEEFPHEAISALLDAARGRGGGAGDGSAVPDDREAAQIAESLAVLLVSDEGGHSLANLVTLLAEPRPVRTVLLQAFVQACRETDGGDATGRPDLLHRYVLTADHEEGTPGAAYRHGLTALWRAALNDRSRTWEALEVLRGWVRLVDRDQEAEWALAWLLRALVATADDLDRLTHMLRSLRAANGGPPPGCAARLLASLTTPVSAPGPATAPDHAPSA